MIEQIITFIKNDVWNIRTKNLDKWRSLGVNSIRIALHSIRDFTKDECVIRASALTYYTLLTIVPVLAMAFGIAQGFGFEKNLQEQIMASFKGQEEIISQIFTFVTAMLERTRGGLIAGIGIVLLFYYIFRIMWNIERTMNVIWKVAKTRPAIRKLTDYMTLTILGPLMVIISGSLNVYIKTAIERITNNYEVLDTFSTLLSTPVRLLPFIMIWLVLTLLYVVMPNKKVKFIPALIAGILAGTAYQITQWGYITFQVGMSNMNAIYGSFAALPLFLIWLQLSWTIILFGAEVAHSIQTMDMHEQYKDAQKLSPHYKQLLILYILHAIIQRYKNEETPLSADEITELLDLPIQTVNESINKLQETKIIAPTQTDKYDAVKYLPARDIEKLSVTHVLDLLDKNGVNDLIMDETTVLGQLEDILVGLYKVGQQSEYNVLLKNMNIKSKT